MNWLFEPFQFEFMVQALVIGLVIAVPSALLSCLLIVKGWSLMGDAVSHAVLPGIVVAHVLKIPIVIGAFAAGMLCAVATGYFSTNSRLKEDTVMGVVFSGMFALGVVMFQQIHTGLHLEHVLFGNILGVNWGDVLQTAIISCLITIFLFIRIKDVKLYAFDQQHAYVIGLNVNLLHYLLLAMLSLVIVAAMKAVGIILVIAILIAPGAIGFLLTKRFETMLIIAVATALSCTTIGIFLSYHIDSAPAPTIVVLMTLVFALTFLLAPNKGVLRVRTVANTG